MAVSALLLLGGCATTPDVPAPLPDFTPVAGEVAPAQGKLIADCLSQAATAGAYRRAGDADSELLLFTCTGAPARAFYDGLAARSAAVGSEVISAGRTIRSTNKVQKDLFGVDYCSTGGADDYACVITLNVGGFLRG